MSRAASFIVGLVAGVGLLAVGFYAGRAMTMRAWDAERYAWAVERDSLTAWADAAEAKSETARVALDSAIARWEALDSARRAAAGHQEPHAAPYAEPHAGPHVDPPAVVSPRLPAPTVITVRADTAGDTATDRQLEACREVVGAAVAYRTACEMAKDSLRALLAHETRETARAKADARAATDRLAHPRRWAVVAGGGYGVCSSTNSAGLHASPVAAVVAGFKLW